MLKSKKFYDINSYQEMKLFKSPVTPLLVPEFNLQPLRTPSLFMKRVFCYFHCQKTIIFPDPSDDQT